MTKVYSDENYDFYIKCGNGDIPTIYNIVPKNSFVPTSGYVSRNYIEKVKGVKFPDRYQPTLHGMRETYMDSNDTQRRC